MAKEKATAPGSVASPAVEPPQPAPPKAEPPAAVAASPPQASLLASLTTHARGAQTTGDYAAHAALQHILVSAGALKHSIEAAQQHVSDEVCSAMLLAFLRTL